MGTPESDRLMQARKRAGYASASDAAKALGVKEPTYLGHENGSRGFKKASAEQYARRFRVSLEWLLTGRESGARATAHKTHAVGAERIIHVPLLDSVTAGKLRAPSSQIPIEDVPLLAFADLGRGEWFALKVDEKGDGDSMDRVSPPGSTIIVNRADRELRSGRCYVFAVGGATTYKMWQDGDPPYLAPYSTNPFHKPIFVKRKRDFEVIGRVKRTVLDL